MNEDNGKILSESSGEGQPEKPKDIVLSIRLIQSTGQFQVDGPGNGKMFDEPMCFYLIEKGKDFIKAMNAKASQPTIVPAKNNIIDFARNGFRK